MKPRNDTIQIKGSLGGEITRMELDQNALVHLMGVLTNLYSDTELAVIREYSTNALDSHIFAGVTDPIEVYTPNALTNEFVVVDHGLGLSKDEIQNVYGNYGASTKRDSDDVAGCLGLGSKSALAYTSAFTVVGIKDGVKTTAVISLAEDGAGRIEVVDEVETDERNGVTVRVPAAYHSDFKDEVTKFFRFWEKGSVLIDGEAPVHYTDNMTQIDDSVWFGDYDRYTDDQITVVMGGVSYGVDDYTYTSRLRNRAVVVMADMGDVDFVPSREALNMTPRTKEYLYELSRYVEQVAERIIQEKIDAAETRREVVKMAQHLLLKDHFGTITWHGVQHQLRPYADHYRYEVSARKSKRDDRFEVAYAYNESVAILTGKPFTHLSGLQRDKLAKYIADNDLNVNKVYYFKGEMPYMAREAKVIKFEDVVSTVVTEKTRSGYKKPDGQKVAWKNWVYDAAEDRVKMSTSLVDPNKTIFYIAGAHSWHGRGTTILKEYKNPNVVLVKIEGNRMGTFKKAYPGAVSEYEYINGLVKALEGFVPEEDWKVANVNRALVKMLKGKTIDPKIDELWAAIKNSKVEEYYDKLRTLGRSDTVDRKIPNNNYIQKNYPLIQQNNPDASIEYVNAMYALRNGKDN